MDMETVRFDGSRWSSEPLRGLDSPRTLVMAFGAAALRERPAVFRALEGAFPESCIIGCSTAGEMHQGTLEDGSLTVAVVRFEDARLASAGAPVASIGESRRAGERIGGGARRRRPAGGLRAVGRAHGQRQRAGRRHHGARAPGGRGDRRAGGRRPGLRQHLGARPRDGPLQHGQRGRHLRRAGRGGARHRRGLGEVRPAAGDHPLGGQRALRAGRASRAGRSTRSTWGAWRRGCRPPACCSRCWCGARATPRPGWCARSSASTRTPSR